MRSRQFLVFIILPVLAGAGFLPALWFLPSRFRQILFAEQGLIELGSAALFALAGGAAWVLCRQGRRHIPNGYRLLFLVFGVAASLVALEEVSYGQHLIGWRSPEWFAQHNSQGETNLHNLLGNKPSRKMRAVASVVYPVGCIILPICFLPRRRAYQPGHWTYYLLPKTELIALVVIAQTFTSIDRVIPALRWAVHWHIGLAELKELYWAAASCLYVVLMRRRLLAPRAHAPEGVCGAGFQPALKKAG